MLVSTKMKNNFEEENNEILGYCAYCKDPIDNEGEDYVVRNKKLFHLDCWNQIQLSNLLESEIDDYRPDK